MRVLLAALLVMLGLLASGSSASAASGKQRVYIVRPGDTVWSIGKRTGISPATLAARNHISNPKRLKPGQRLLLDGSASMTAPPSSTAAQEAVSGIAARQLVATAAREFGLDPNLVQAVALWESGDNQSAVSSAGALGLMQILPSTADWAGPALLGRRVDIRKASDNAELGAALLRRYLDEFRSPLLALAAYYQGETATRLYGIFPSSSPYVQGIWALRNLLQAGG